MAQVTEATAGDGPPTVSVTAAPFRVLCAFLRDGASDAVLAERLNLSVATVRAHMKVLLAATGCPNRAALAVALLRRHLVVERRGSLPPGPRPASEAGQ